MTTMNKRTTGVGLLAIAAFLYATRYIAAAIFGSGIASFSTELFRSMLQYVGIAPLIWSILAAIAGVAYLVWAESDERLQRLSK
jgi:hypothetical protein